MKKQKLYKYNPATNDFERYYPGIKSQLYSILRISLLSIVGGILIFILIFYCFDSPTEVNLKKENQELRTQYNVLNKRLESALSVMEDLRQRDDNFYRVIMQSEPLSEQERYSGLERENKYKGLKSLSDVRLLAELTQEMDFLEKQIAAQSKSYDQIRSEYLAKQDKMLHIPSIIPISIDNATIASGYGKRVDPIYNVIKFHEGIDFVAPIGTDVYSTAIGEVIEVGKDTRFGNYVIVDHGNNYTTYYSHLKDIKVEKGNMINRGERIGTVGNSGKSLGSHLHYEVRFKGNAENPVNYYFMDLSPKQYSTMMRNADNAGHVMD